MTQAQLSIFTKKTAFDFSCRKQRSEVKRTWTSSTRRSIDQARNRFFARRAVHFVRFSSAGDELLIARSIARGSLGLHSTTPTEFQSNFKNCSLRTRLVEWERPSAAWRQPCGTCHGQVSYYLDRCNWLDVFGQLLRVKKDLKQLLNGGFLHSASSHVQFHECQISKAVFLHSLLK